MYRNRNLSPIYLQDGITVELSPSLHVTPHTIMHRADFTDTFAFSISGPQRSMYFCPDIDSWASMELELVRLSHEKDYLLVDATFYDDNELVGRDMSAIPHPRVTDTVTRLAKELSVCRAEEGPEEGEGVSIAGNKVVLIHLNHSNRLWSKENEAERERLRKMGFDVGRSGMRWIL